MNKYEGRCERCGAQLTIWAKTLEDCDVHDDYDPSGEYCGGKVVTTQVTQLSDATAQKDTTK